MVPDEFVVDLTVEFAADEVDAEKVLSDLEVPGTVLARDASRDRLAVTTVVPAPDESSGVAAVCEAILAQLRGTAPFVVGRWVASSSVGSLLGLVDPGLPDESYATIELIDLVERHLWTQPPREYGSFVALERRRLAPSA